MRRVYSVCEYSLEACQDLYVMCLECEDAKLKRKYLKLLNECIEYKIRTMQDIEIGEHDLLNVQVMRVLSRYDFDTYMRYIEWEREPKKKFYIPRRRALLPVVKELQRLADGEIELLSISLPPGVGKTTLAIFFLTFMAGREPDETLLGFSHSGSVMSGVYRECLRIIEGDEYLWKDIFPDTPLCSTNAKELRIDLGSPKRFETLEFTSIDSQNAGKLRATNLLYCDDLVSGIEVALSKDRLDKLWSEYTVDARQRKQGDCRELHIATRWSTKDVIGRLQNEYGNDPKAVFITCPALDENDESNFDFPYGVGFSTEVYRKQREIMDEVSWNCLYMNVPMEREGLLYPEAELRRFYDLPTEEPDGIFAICDTKDRGADYCVMPIAFNYGQDFYIVDCICDNGKPELVESRLSEILLKYNVHQCRFESNSAGGRIAEKVQKEVRERGGRTKIQTKYTTANKETKIMVNAPFIKEHFLFKSQEMYHRNDDYGKMIAMLCSYTMYGVNKHDDVPDALAMLSEFVSYKQKQVVAFQRPF